MKPDAKTHAVLEEFLAAPRPSQEAAISALGEFFVQLRSEWEARPENRDKAVSYRELWDEFGAQINAADTIVQWDSKPPPVIVEVSEIEHFDARGMKRVYGRGDSFGPHRSFHMDIWMDRCGRLLMRFWSRCADIQGHSFQIKGHDPDGIPGKSHSAVLPELWVPLAARRTYGMWIQEEL